MSFEFMDYIIIRHKKHWGLNHFLNLEFNMLKLTVFTTLDHSRHAAPFTGIFAPFSKNL